MAQSNNARLGLTGFLFFQGLKFYGLLEGPESVLLDRMEKIVMDRRHRRIRVLRESSIESRRFENWCFAILPAPERFGLVEPISESFIQTLAKRLS